MPVSIVIPAHNEESVIGRCLERLLDGAQGDFDVVVVVNGSSDSTAAVARRFAGVRVEELEVASKVAALNHGDSLASGFPRVYLDADVEVTADAVREVAAALSRPGVAVAAPTISFGLDGRPFLVRCFYAAWQRTPFLHAGVVGNGFYALSENGRRRFDRFPDVTGDDMYVYGLFTDSERLTVDSATFTVHTPRAVRDLIMVRTRVYFGNQEMRDLDLLGGGGRDASASSAAQLLLSTRGPRQLLENVVYLGVNTVAKVAARRKRSKGTGVRWERDDSSRSVT